MPTPSQGGDSAPHPTRPRCGHSYIAATLTEFANPSMDMFGYTEGMFASVGFDGSDYELSVSGNLFCIIHGDDTDGYFLSIYLEDEIPW